MPKIGLTTSTLASTHQHDFTNNPSVPPAGTPAGCLSGDSVRIQKKQIIGPNNPTKAATSLESPSRYSGCFSNIITRSDRSYWCNNLIHICDTTNGNCIDWLTSKHDTVEQTGMTTIQDFHCQAFDQINATLPETNGFKNRNCPTPKA